MQTSPDKTAVQVRLPELVALTLTRIEFELTPNFVATSESAFNFDMDFGVACRRTANKDFRSVFVEVKLKPVGAETTIPYRGKISAMAQIGHFDAALDESARDAQAVNFGAPVAYGMIRDEFLRITGMMPYTRMMLPLLPRQAMTDNATYEDVNGKALPAPQGT